MPCYPGQEIDTTVGGSSGGTLRTLTLQPSEEHAIARPRQPEGLEVTETLQPKNPFFLGALPNDFYDGERFFEVDGNKRVMGRRDEDGVDIGLVDTRDAERGATYLSRRIVVVWKEDDEDQEVSMCVHDECGETCFVRIDGKQCTKGKVYALSYGNVLRVGPDLVDGKQYDVFQFQIIASADAELTTSPPKPILQRKKPDKQKPRLNRRQRDRLRRQRGLEAAVAQPQATADRSLPPRARHGLNRIMNIAKDTIESAGQARDVQDVRKLLNGLAHRVDKAEKDFKHFHERDSRRQQTT